MASVEAFDVHCHAGTLLAEHRVQPEVLPSGLRCHLTRVRIWKKRRRTWLLRCKHFVEDVAQQPLARAAYFLRGFLAHGDDGRRSIVPERTASEVRIFRGPHARELGVGLDVKLQPEGAPADTKCLIGAGVALGQSHSPGGKIEGVPVPVKDGDPVRQPSQRRLVVGSQQPDLPESDLAAWPQEPTAIWALICVHATAGRVGKKLGTKTHAQHRLTFCQNLSQKGNLA